LFNNAAAYTMTILGSALLRAQIACAKKETPEIVGVLAHDPSAFTQGLTIHNGELYESTGLEGQSSLRRLCTKTGAVLESIAMAPDVFGEDITGLDDKIYQLTYTSGKALSYSLDPLAAVEALPLSQQEGWGLVTWNGHLLASDGSHRLREYTRRFELTDTYRAKAFGLPLRRLNAMTVRGHFILANLWYTHYLAEIHTRTFRLTRAIDCRELVAREAPESPDHILNGIAWDRARGVFWMTGKHWKHLFAVRFPEQDKVD
jgi:glutaminyl-peptide cyclotransferase